MLSVREVKPRILLTLSMCLFSPGYPASERAVRGSTNIQVLSDEDQEDLRVACKVRYH